MKSQTQSQPHLTKRIPINYRARVTSLLYVIENIFCAVGQIIIGYIYDYIGIITAWLIIISIGIFTIISYQLLKRGDEKAYPDLYKTQFIAF